MNKFTQGFFDVSLCKNFTVDNIVDCLIRNNIRKGDIDNLKKDLQRKKSGKKRFSKREIECIAEHFNIDKSYLFELGVSDDTKKALIVTRALGVKCHLSDFRTVVYDTGKQGTVTVDNKNHVHDIPPLRRYSI